MNEEVKGNKILDPDYLPKGEMEIEAEWKDVGEEDNVRFKAKVNIPAGCALFQIVESQPPMLVVMVRADKDLVALGVLEKAKFLVHAYQAKIDPKVELTRGVRSASAALLTKH